MPVSSNITTSSGRAFQIPKGKYGAIITNESDTAIRIRLAKSSANTVVSTTSDANTGILIPAKEGNMPSVVSICPSTTTPFADNVDVMAIHGGSGNKTLIYEILELPMEVTTNSAVPAATISGDVTIENAAVTVADGADVAMGTTTDTPSTSTEDATSRTGISLLKGIKNYLKTITGWTLNAGNTDATTQRVVIATNQAAVATSIASGGVASGAISSGAVASGAFASGSVADGAMVTLGAKADAKSSATDTTAITLMSVAKQISASVQALLTGTILAAGSAIIGKVTIDNTTDGTTNRVSSFPKQSNGAASTASVATADGTVFTLAAGEIGFIQNLKSSIALAVKLGASASTSSFNVILKGGNADDDGNGGLITIDDFIGAVSVATMSGTGRYIAWKRAVG